MHSTDANKLNYYFLNVFSHLERIFCRRDIHLHPKFVGKSNDSTQQHASNKSSCESGPQIKGTLPQKESLKLPPIVSSSSQVSSEMLRNKINYCVHTLYFSLNWLQQVA